MLKILKTSMVLGLLCTLLWAVPSLANEESDYRNLEIFTDVLSLIRNSYVEEVDTDQLVYGAIRGMLETLDPHSSFLTPEMFEEMQADTHGEFGGLGIEITVQDGALLVVSPISGTPAFEAGIKAGDRIVRIGDQDTQDMEIMEAVRLLRGPKGSEVKITVVRPDVRDPLVFGIVRDTIQIESVTSRLLNNRYGYVRISQFQDRTANDLQKALEEMRKKSHEQEMSGLILDLRNNPGGLLDQAVAVSDLFLEEGLIVYTEGRETESELKFSAQAAGTEPDYPLVVLINGGSASASEIVAGALQDQGRAVVLGEQSFGKGSVQTIIPLDDQSGLRLTTARYYTPAGRSIQALGITPDIQVPQVEVVSDGDSATTMREVDLDNHFQAAGSSTDTGTSQETSSDQLEDYQLQRAVDLLKGLEIFNRGKTAGRL